MTRFGQIVTNAVVAGALACVGLAGAIDVRAASPGSTLVTATIANTQNGYLLRVESDSQGNYVTTKLTSSSISGGDWILDTSSNPARTSMRTVFFDLTEPVSPTNPPPPFQTAYVQSHLLSACSKVNLSFLQIPAGTTVQCPGAFRFLAPNGLTYRLGFQPNNYPEVNPMNVTCNAADSGGCKLWTIWPSGTTVTATDPLPKNRNKLLQIDPGSDVVLADLGDYYISFLITLAR
jgi:hypothetical protein